LIRLNKYGLVGNSESFLLYENHCANKQTTDEHASVKAEEKAEEEEE
jgi:hypothetical protein